MSLQIKLKRFLKVLVRALQYLLPEQLFNNLYQFAFTIYRSIVRTFYLIKGVVFYSYRNPMKWQMVKKVYSIMPYSLVGIGGLEATYNAAYELNNKGIEGDFVELGVARGGCAALIGSVIFDKGKRNKLNRKLWLFDSYKGLPEPTEDDFDNSRGEGTGEHVRPLPKGSCLGMLDEVKKLMFDICAYPVDKLVFVKGWFQDTIPIESEKIKIIALLRIDGDWYESTKCCLEGLYDKVVPGGIVMIDDYQSCYGCEKAVDEFISERGLNVTMNFDGRGGCFFTK